MAKSKLTPETQEQICGIIRATGCKRDAAIASGIDESSFYRWLKLGQLYNKGKYREFFQSVKKAETAHKLSLLSTIRTASKRNWQAAAWTLERMYRSEFSRDAQQIETGTDGRPWHSIRDVADSVYSQFTWTQFHTYLAYKLDCWLAAHRAGRAPRLHISTQPQVGKSTLARMASAALMHQNPTHNLAWISYAADFAEGASRTIRNWLYEYQPATFPEKRTKLTQREWETKRGGSMFATGTGGILTGKTVDAFVFDDLLKDTETMLSQAWQRKFRNWMEGTADSRITNQTSVLSIGTRWGKNDAIEHIIECVGGDWEIINIPALAIEGDVLGREINEVVWPEKQSFELLEDRRRKLPLAIWEALYQQSPISLTGDFFLYDKWRRGDKPTEGMNKTCRFWDLGFVEDGHPTASAKLYTVGRDIHILDRTKWTTDTPTSIERIVRTIKKDGPGVLVGIESNGPQSGIAQMIKKRLGSEYEVWLRGNKPDKTADARMWQPEQHDGMVWDHTDDDGFKDRAALFPEKDIDEIDAISGAMWMQRRLKLFEGLAG